MNDDTDTFEPQPRTSHRRRALLPPPPLPLSCAAALRAQPSLRVLDWSDASLFEEADNKILLTGEELKPSLMSTVDLCYVPRSSRIDTLWIIFSTSGRTALLFGGCFKSSAVADGCSKSYQTARDWRGMSEDAS